MAGNDGSDDNLLKRLNALQQTDISLGAQPKHTAAAAAATLGPVAGQSREDALSSRLKNLRHQMNSGEAPVRDAAGALASGDPEPLKQTDPVAQPPAGQGRTPDTFDTSQSPPETVRLAGEEDPGSLLDTDDQTLEELLADLGSDEEWLDQVAAEEEEHQKAIALLKELGRAPIEPDRPEYRAENDDGADSDDDSEAGSMKLEADEVMSKALDEVELKNSSNTPPDDTRALEPDPSHKAAGNAFSLPIVPSELQDQSELAEDDPDFEVSMNLRMAALNVSPSTKLELPSVPGTDVDPLGLPGAPTFAPRDRPVPGLIKRQGYTDEDAASWCTVCLEDATVRCLGCDGEVYCAKCWKAMHIGPMAGYDERGHRWEKYIRVK